jgi:activator of HSP90 ATPase
MSNSNSKKNSLRFDHSRNIWVEEGSREMNNNVKSVNSVNSNNNVNTISTLPSNTSAIIRYPTSSNGGSNINNSVNPLLMYVIWNQFIKIQWTWIYMLIKFINLDEI